jgi:hypothetical protein
MKMVIKMVMKMASYPSLPWVEAISATSARLWRASSPGRHFRKPPRMAAVAAAEAVVAVVAVVAVAAADRHDVALYRL